GPDRAVDFALQCGVQLHAVGEDDEERHLVPAAWQFEADDQAVDDLGESLDDAVQLARPEPDPLAVERRVRTTFDDRAPPLRDADPVPVAPDARVHLEVALAVARPIGVVP